MADIDAEMRSVISWFNSAEQMLIDVLDVLPYEPAHECVWSPRLATIMLESCSQIDSALKHQLRQSPHITKSSLTIRDYFQYFGEPLSAKWVVFWGELPVAIRPFDAWKGAVRFHADSYNGHELPWWKAYNDLKHNRIEYRKQATLRHATEALSGLLLAILHCPTFHGAIAAAGWMTSHEGGASALLDDHLNPMPHNYGLAETKLFAYPAGWMKEPIGIGDHWIGACSDRFQMWFGSPSSHQSSI